MQHEVKPTFTVETSPEPSSRPRQPVRLRLRLGGMWEGGRCALDAEPATLTEAREAELEFSDRLGSVEVGGRFLDGADHPPSTRFPLPAADSNGFWRQVWEQALRALAGRLAREIDYRREKSEAASSGVGWLPEEGAVGEAIVDVYLPLLRRNESRLIPPAGNSLEVEVDEFHRVRVLIAESPAARWERMNFQQAALLLAGALPRPACTAQRAPALRFADTRRLSAPQLRHSLPRLLEGCGFKVPPALSAAGAGQISPEAEVSIALGLAPAEAAAWFEAPRQRSPEYYEAFGRVSQAIQRALRAWLPYLFFSELDRYSDAETAYPMLAYQASRPLSRKGSPEFTYDVMNPESVQRALRSASTPLAELLQSASAILAASGRQALAHRYRRLEPRALVEAVKRAPRAFQSLLAAEACFMSAVIKLALEARLLREEPAEAPRRLHRMISQFTEGLHQRLRRLYCGLSPVGLGSLVLIEANRALSLAYGLGVPLEAVVRIRPSSGPEAEFVLVGDGAPGAERDAERL
jgi:hypothetical protein